MRTLHKLTARQAKSTKEPGLYSDGGGLYLQVAKGGSQSWIFRYKQRGRERYMGLGGFESVSLSKAREKAAQCREQLQDNIDPIDAREAERARERVNSAKSMTFKDCAEAYVAAHEGSWRNAKHAQQWTNTLSTYALPHIGDLPVSEIDTGLVMKILEPIWYTKTETASRVRGRIEAVLDWARVRDYRTGENPARWRGHLDKLLPARTKAKPVKHMPALPYDELPAFLSELQVSEATGSLGLQFLILTACRTGEVIGARWSEIDLKKAIWTIPGKRMKAGKEHRVPLCDEALDILHQLEQRRVSDFVFPGQRPNSHLSNMAFLQKLKRMSRQDITAHGFRSTFRDWAAERTGYPSEVVEMALAHTVSDKVEAAYRRGDLFEKRKRLMSDWAKFCLSPESTGEVVEMKRG